MIKCHRWWSKARRKVCVQLEYFSIARKEFLAFEEENTKRRPCETFLVSIFSNAERKPKRKPLHSLKRERKDARYIVTESTDRNHLFVTRRFIYSPWDFLSSFSLAKNFYKDLNESPIPQESLWKLPPALQILLSATAVSTPETHLVARQFIHKVFLTADNFIAVFQSLCLLHSSGEILTTEFPGWSNVLKIAWISGKNTSSKSRPVLIIVSQWKIGLRN